MFFRFSPQKSWQEKVLERVFKNRKICEERLLPFGCVRGKRGFLYRAGLLNGALSMEFEICTDGSVHVTLHSVHGEEYERMLDSQGTPRSYLGRKLRQEYEEELWHVAECCFVPDAFKEDMTLRIIDHIRNTYGDELEFLWRKFPENAIVRRRDKKKWYAALLVVPRFKLTGDSEERVEILNLRVCPDDLEHLVDNRSRFPGYHMNKKNWATFCLDGSIPFDELTTRLETSYRLVRK